MNKENLFHAKQKIKKFEYVKLNRDSSKIDLSQQEIIVDSLKKIENNQILMANVLS